MERTVRTQRPVTTKEEETNQVEEVEASENGYSDPNPCTDKADDSVSNHDASTAPQEATNGSPSPSPNTNGPPPPTVQRSRSQSKVKLLVRSHAVREETSPPPEPAGSPPPPPPPPLTSSSNSAQSGQVVRTRHKLRRDGSSQGSTESWEPTLSRGNSRDQYDGTGIDLEQFITETLNKNHKDRMLLLKIEHELINLAKDSKRTVHKFGQMSSYQRMLVHRVAAYFGMEHNVDPTGASVIVNTTKSTRIPDTRFRDFVRDDLLLPEEPRRSILKRDSSSFDETGSFKNGDRLLNGDSRRSKSFEEREEEYQIARRRIFNRELSFQGDGDVSCLETLQWESEAVCTQCEHSGRAQSQIGSSERSCRLLKVESYESGETLKANSLKLSVAKSHSFNGYDPPPHNTRILTKQDSGSSMSSRISPSSSGYKSQRSDATLSATPSPTATPSLHNQLSSQSGGLSPEGDGGAVVWAVTDLASVPPGSMLIHPQTGQPYTNPDGSIYHYDPNNPPRVRDPSGSHSAESPGSLMVNKMAAAGGPPPIVHTQPSQDMPEAMTGDLSSTSFSQGKPPHSLHTFDNYSTPFHPEPVLANMPGHNVTFGGPGQAPSYGQHPGPAQQYSIVLPPQEPVSMYHPVPMCTGYCPQQYDPRVNENLSGSDLSGYMVGLSIDNCRTLPENSRSPLYWQSHHVPNGSGGCGAVPVCFNGANNPGANRFSGTSNNGAGTPGGQGPSGSPSVPQPVSLNLTHLQGHPPPSPHILSAPPQPPQAIHHHPVQHHSLPAGTCYATTYSNSNGECLPPPPPYPAVYYSQPIASSTANQNQTFCPSVSSSSPVVTLQYPQPCAHPNPSHTNHGVSGQYAIYNGCYPSHYPQPSSSLPVAPLFRKSNLQVGIRCNSPMRPSYQNSNKERVVEEKHPQQPTTGPVHHVPMYGIRVLPGDMRLLQNAGRLPFPIGGPKSTHNRKNRCKGNVGRNPPSNGNGRILQQPMDAPRSQQQIC